MAFADWDHVIATSSGGLAAQLDSGADKIRGNSSLAYANPAVGGSPNQPRVVSGWGAGVTANFGLVQTMFRRVDASGGGFGGSVYCLMQGSTDPASECYILLYSGTTLSLFRATYEQLALLSGGVLLEQVTGLPDSSDQDVYALELKWQYDAGSGGMILIGGYDGPIADPASYDYSTITKVINHTDSPPLIDGVSAGVGWFYQGSNPAGEGNTCITYDGTQIFWPA